LKLERVERVAAAVRSGDLAGLDAEDAELALGFKAKVSADIAARIGRRDAGIKQEPQRDADGGASSNGTSSSNGAASSNGNASSNGGATPKGDTPDFGDPSSINVVLEDGGDPSSFSIVFQCPPGEVLGRDLIYSLAGLERQRPPSDSPRVPLHELRVANSNDKEINPDAPLFPQLGADPSVYLMPSEVTVSEAEN
jgi:hypothetical protein